MYKYVYILIDWEGYLRMVTPTSVHDYILANPVLFVQNMSYMKRVNELLAKTPHRTLINYVIIQYLKSWLPLVGKPHTDVIDVGNMLTFFSCVFNVIGQVKEFLDKSQLYVPTRADRCVALVKSTMPMAVGAMYARAVSSEVCLLERMPLLDPASAE
ncbi:hypothetical protein ANCCAN_01081 [Ancylostoma caninum]|uniref:Peptidase M13 N-terminal domain-containing protein n=1 Tax=Ancylostoma caninum TaxID=29170 RepID=A0A368HBT0_ANCCA|nr:hypothetical protein ANCCAN_01081 [Ancylostoma caninum]